MMLIVSILQIFQIIDSTPFLISPKGEMFLLFYSFPFGGRLGRGYKIKKT